MTTEIFDCEVYIDYFLVAFRDVETLEVTTFEQYPDHPLDTKALRKHMGTRRVVSFNGKRFDAPLVALAITGATCAELKAAASDIIQNNLQPWQFEQRHPCRIDPEWDHIDLFDVAPGMASLKIYAGRMHSRKLQDLPIAFDASIGVEDRAKLLDYCVNGDTIATLDLWRTLSAQIELREKMTERYGIDLRSKSDAQIAEAVIKSQVSQLIGKKVERPIIAPGTEFKYRAPDFVRFSHPALRHAFDVVTSVPFVVQRAGGVAMPKEISELKITVGGTTYQMGIGGLHSTESSVAHLAADDTLLIDRDVTSYYPSIILNCGLAPNHLGAAFLRVYRGLVDQRLAAKRAGDKVTADALKITINGTFGKLGSMWSALYSPDLLIRTTITGQLSLLMLIEMLEDYGAAVVSANTDGVVIKCPRPREIAMDAVVSAWETATGFETEETNYRALYSRDVNNYLAIKPDGKVKAKGVYAPPGLQKNPANEICNVAVARFLADGKPIEQTINECEDIRRFVTVRQVNGGCVDQTGEFLGRAARWYYSKFVDGPLRYKTNGYTVARSEGAMPLMMLPEKVPTDLDRDWYVREAHSILADIGWKS